MILLDINKYLLALDLLDWIVISILLAVAVGSLLYVFIFPPKINNRNAAQQKKKSVGEDNRSQVVEPVIPAKNSEVEKSEASSETSPKEEPAARNQNAKPEVKPVTQVKPVTPDNPLDDKTNVDQQTKPAEISSTNPVERSPVIHKITPTSRILVTPAVEKEEQSSVKYIGYDPANIFLQNEPLHFPYVLMPKPGCVIKFPRKGRVGRKGYTEDAFKMYLAKYFSSRMKLYDDRIVTLKNSTNPIEPDFSLIDEKNGLNLFLDIEIDEPYEGTNNVITRKPMHYQYADQQRNKALTTRGWMVIRFAEIQVHKQQEACCLFIADVIKSILPSFDIPQVLADRPKVRPVQQWTKEQAQTWSLEKYREKYLGITAFGITHVAERDTLINETELGEQIEKEVVDEPVQKAQQTSPQQINVNPFELAITQALLANGYLSFEYEGSRTIVKPVSYASRQLAAYCYIKNEQRVFNLSRIKDLVPKTSWCITEAKGPVIGIDRIRIMVNTAIQYNRYIRMTYTRSSWIDWVVDETTGEVMADITDAETQVRTINNVQLALNALAEPEVNYYRLNNDYITAYCNLREEKRTFKFDRISEIAVLNI